MIDWASGYVADIDYLPGFYAEQMPAHLDLVCLIQGIYSPRRAGERFTYCELGCGLGETALTLAACHPEAEVHAFDFNPSHIAAAEEAARLAGLSNIHFAERSFADLAHCPDGTLPLFDYITVHGVWTWVAREQQLEIVEILSRFVRPGGIVAVTYNSQPGWSDLLPLQRLLFDFAAQQDGRSDQRVEAALHFVEAARRAGSQAIPQSFLQSLFNQRERSSAYLAHEYLNTAWQPAYHADVAADMARAKLSYVGSATVLENFPPVFLSEEQLKLVAAAPAPIQETLKDHFNPRLFRRDVFVRGARAIKPLLRTRMLEDLRLTQATSKAATQHKLTLPHGEVEFKSPFYGYLAKVLEEGDATLSQIKQRPDAPPMPQAAEVLAVGLETRAAVVIEHRMSEGDRERIRRINLAIVRNAIAQAQSTTSLAAFAVAGGLRIVLIPMLAYEALATGTPETVEALARRCTELLLERGEHLRKGETILATPEALMPALNEAALDILERVLPVWRRLGAF